MGGSNSKDNIVNLTAEEHYVAHQLLVKLYPEIGGLAVAAYFMAKKGANNKDYAWLRRRYVAFSSQFLRGNTHTLGKKLRPRSAEHTLKISKALTGNKHSEAWNKNNAAAQMGKTISQETKTKMSLSKMGNTNTKGKKLSDEHRAKLSLALLGNKRGVGRIFSIEHRAKLSAARKRRSKEVSRASVLKSWSTRRSHKMTVEAVI